MDVLTHCVSVASPALVVSGPLRMCGRAGNSQRSRHSHPRPASLPCSPSPCPRSFVVPCLMPGTNLVWITTPALSPAPRWSTALASHWPCRCNTWPSVLSPPPPLALRPCPRPGSHQNVCFRIMACSSSHVFRASAVLPFPASTTAGGNPKTRCTGRGFGAGPTPRLPRGTAGVIWETRNGNEAAREGARRRAGARTWGKAGGRPG